MIYTNNNNNLQQQLTRPLAQISIEGMVLQDVWPSLMEHDVQWKSTFDGGWPSMEDDNRWDIFSDWRQDSIEDNLSQKMAFNGRQAALNRWAAKYPDLDKVEIANF